MAIRGLTRAIGALDNCVTAKLLPLFVVRAKYAALCPQTISTPPLESVAIRATCALPPAAIPLVFDTLTGAENAVVVPTRLLNKISPPPAVLIPAHATYTTAHVIAHH